MFLTFLGYAYEFDLGHLDQPSWLPWAIAFDTLHIFEVIMGTAAGRLILGRSRGVVIARISAAGFTLLSLIPGYYSRLGVDANTSFSLLIVLAPASFFGADREAHRVLTELACPRQGAVMTGAGIPSG